MPTAYYCAPCTSASLVITENNGTRHGIDFWYYNLGCGFTGVKTMKKALFINYFSSAPTFTEDVELLKSALSARGRVIPQGDAKHSMARFDLWTDYTAQDLHDVLLALNLTGELRVADEEKDDDYEENTA